MAGHLGRTDRITFTDRPRSDRPAEVSKTEKGLAMTATDRPQLTERRLLEVLGIVERYGPMTLASVLAELADTPLACSERHLRRTVNLLVENGRLTYDRDAKMIAVAYPMTILDSTG